MSPSYRLRSFSQCFNAQSATEFAKWVTIIVARSNLLSNYLFVTLLAQAASSILLRGSMLALLLCGGGEGLGHSKLSIVAAASFSQRDVP